MQNSGQLLLLGVLLVFAVWVFSRGRRQQRQMQATQSRLRPGTQVMMTSGVYGTVVEVADDGLVRLETSPGVVSRWDRRAVARIVSSTDVPAELSAEPAEPVEPGEPAEQVRPIDVGPAEPVEQVEPGRPVQDAAPPDRD